MKNFDKKIKEIIKGDVITFKTKDKSFKAIICTGVVKSKSPYLYSFCFVATTCDSKNIPTINEITDLEFYGVACNKNNYYINRDGELYLFFEKFIDENNYKDVTSDYTEIELEKMWKIHPGIKPFALGSYSISITRKEFWKFKDKLIKIGNLKLVDNLYRMGNKGVNASDYKFLIDLFSKDIDKKMKEENQKKYKIRALINEAETH